MDITAEEVYSTLRTKVRNIKDRPFQPFKDAEVEMEKLAEKFTDTTLDNDVKAIM